jgi:hypothetical protein
MININYISYLAKKNEKATLLVFALITLLIGYLVAKQTKWLKTLDVDRETALAAYPAVTRLKFRGLINSFEQKGYTVVITSAVRANGNDPHTRKHAIDINLVHKITGEHFTMETSREKWLSTGCPQIAIAAGFRWGGNFKTPYMYKGILRPAYDPVHFDLE